MKNKVSSFLSRVTALALFTAPVCSVQAQEVYSATIGATAVTVPSDSDVMVALPFKQEKAAGGSVTAVDGAVASLQGSTLTAEDFDATGGVPTHYLYVETGDLKGRHFNIVSNTASTVTLDTTELTGLNGADISIREHWTLGMLFPNGVGGVVEDEPGRRKVEVILPAKASVGGGLAAKRIFYFYNGAWREVGKALATESDSVVVESGTAMVVRNHAASDLSYFFFGEVEYGPMAIPLVSSDSDTVDNFVAVERPLGMTIDELQLHTSGAFGPDDRLLVYPHDPGLLGTEKSPDVYFYDGTWQLEGGDGGNAGTTQINAGQGLAIRKAPGASATEFWVNEWSISEQ